MKLICTVPMLKLRYVWAVPPVWSFLDRVPHSAFAKGPVPDSAFLRKNKPFFADFTSHLNFQFNKMGTL